MGVFVAVTTHNVSNREFSSFYFLCSESYFTVIALSTIVASQGGVFLNSFPMKEQFNIGSRPYLHAHLGPLFLIHDASVDLTDYRNDPDHMYTLFTEEEFICFLLKRETNPDTRVNPPSVLKREE
uniref:TLDc domain-containing protein n=1 Tax=Caenorhabditis tropicalis TaxID=1561998 RepID=A0A1I7SXN3_9PELO